MHDGASCPWEQGRTVTPAYQRMHRPHLDPCPEAVADEVWAMPPPPPPEAAAAAALASSPTKRSASSDWRVEYKCA